MKFAKAIHETQYQLDYIHSDLWEPSRVPSIGGARYFLTLIDDYSRKVWIYFLKNKSETFLKFKELKILVKTQTYRKVKKLRTDNGLEFLSNDFNSFCQKEGIATHRTVRYTPQQNGLAERMNKTILERVRCMLSSSRLSKGVKGSLG